VGKIIDLKSYKETISSSPIDQLALLSVFYFKDEYGEEVKDLEDEVRYALAIMVYKFLKSAEDEGKLVINKKGFMIDTEMKKELSHSIKAALDSQNITLN